MLAMRADITELRTGDKIVEGVIDQIVYVIREVEPYLYDRGIKTLHLIRVSDGQEFLHTGSEGDTFQRVIQD